MELRESFAVFDGDDNGHVTSEEIGKVLHRVGQHVTKEETDELLKSHDVDKSGSLEFGEFLTLMSSKMREIDSEEELREAFSVFDRDENGLVSKDELSKLLLSLGEGLTVPEIEAMMASADEDGDGELNFEEFKIMLQGRRDENNFLLADCVHEALGHGAEGHAGGLHRTESTLHPREANAGLDAEDQEATLSLEHVMTMLERAEKYPDSVDSRARVLNIKDFLFMHGC